MRFGCKATHLVLLRDHANNHCKGSVLESLCLKFIHQVIVLFLIKGTRGFLATRFAIALLSGPNAIFWWVYVLKTMLRHPINGNLG